jgi:hypothetical protein
MKAAKLLITVLMMLALLAPGGQAAANQWMNAGEYGLKGEVKSVAESQQISGKTGAWVTVPLRTVTYDRAGNAVRAVIYKGPGAYTEQGYFYDSVGRMLASGRYLKDGAFVKEVEYAYDDSGKLTGNHYLRDDGSVFLSKTYIYDEQGNMAEERHSAAGQPVLTKKFLTDRDNNEQIITIYGPDGRLLATERSKLAGDGSSTQEWHYHGDLSGYGPRHRVVATDNNTSNTVCYLPDGTVYQYIVCDTREGDTVKRTVQRADGSLVSELHFDAAGNMTMALKFAADGAVEKAEKFVYTYDAQGNWTVRAVFERPSGRDDWQATGEIRRVFAYF